MTVKFVYREKYLCIMKRILTIQALLLAAISFVGCGVTWSNVAYHDDLYEIHDKTKIAKEQQAMAELNAARKAAEKAEYEALLAQTSSNVNGYDAVLADDYESAYARRLYGFSSPTYRMPSSYYDYRYSDAFFYASAYDPAFYNVMVSGDMVWVEPRYVTAMFGSWGAAVVPSYSWYYGWGSPYSSWWSSPYYGYGWNNYWYSGIYNPYLYWGYPYYHYPYHHHHYHPHHHHHHHHHGGVGNTGHSRYDFNDRVYRNRGAAVPDVRGGSSSYRPNDSYRGSTPSNGSSYRSNGGGSSRGSGSSSSYRSNGGSSTYRSSGSSGTTYKTQSTIKSKPTYRSSGSSSSSSYRSSGSSSSSSYRSSGSSNSSSYRSSGGGSSYSSGGSSYSSGGSTHGR